MLVRAREGMCSRLESLRMPGEKTIDLCSRLGVSQHTWFTWKRMESAQMEPKDALLDRIGQNSGVSPVWIRLGIGPRNLEAAERWLEEQTVGEREEQGEGNR